MASVYDMEGMPLTEGLQGCEVCDEAIQVAKRIAAQRGETVLLHDDDGEWMVSPSGEAERAERW